MPKRLSDTDIWSKDWFLDLSIKQKLIVKFLFDNCDCAGFYEISWRNLKNCFGEEIKKEDFEGLKQICFVNDNTIFIEDFINFQYLTPDRPYLNPNSKVHLGVIRRLIKNNIGYEKYLNPLKRVSKPFQKGTGVGVGVGIGIGKKEEEGCGEKEKTNPSIDATETARQQSEKPLNPGFEQKTGINPDVYISGFKPYFDHYKELCPKLAKLTFETRNRECIDSLAAFVEETNSDLEYFKGLCKKANLLKSIVKGRVIDFKSLIRNHIRIMNGAYEPKEEDTQANLPQAYKRPQCLIDGERERQAAMDNPVTEEQRAAARAALLAKLNKHPT